MMFISGMVSLAVLGIISAINIDNELRIIKVDCYERIQIGQRLSPSMVYKSFNYNTVGDCKKACSEEKSACKSFSFGISAKGNATCELSSTLIKETPDSKTAGTEPNVDFDLYVKKPGCTVVTEKHPHHKPTDDHFVKPTTLGKVPLEEIGHPPHPGSYPQPQEGIQNVHTLVSIASGPQSVLNPVHGILVAPQEQENHGLENEAFPFLSENYSEHYGTFGHGFGSWDFGTEFMKFDRPDFAPLYQDIDRQDNSYYFRYGERPQKRPHSPKNDYPRYPNPDRYGSVIPHPNHYYQRPTAEQFPYPIYRPNSIERPEYHYHRPSRPYDDKPIEENIPLKQPTSKPVTISLIYEIETHPTLVQKPQTKPVYETGPNENEDKHPLYGVQEYSEKPITTHSTGYNGGEITSIITEIKEACFRRVLAGKRISRGLVRRALSCESVEECQKECADEKIFACEGFNYRLDPSGRAKGDCELLSVPLSRLDVYRDSYPDPDYDYYERDRNAAALNCRPGPPSRPYNNYNNYDGYRHDIRDGYDYGSRNRWPDRRYDYVPRPVVSYHGSVDYRGADRWRNDEYYRKPIRPEIDRRYDYGPDNRRRGDHYLPRPNQDDRNNNRRYFNDHILPQKPPPYSPKGYDTPPYYKYEKKFPWGFEHHHRYGEGYDYPVPKKNFYLPPSRTDDSINDLNWGLYHKFQNNYSHWGDKYGGTYGVPHGGYLPPEPELVPPSVGNYLPAGKPVDDTGIFRVPDSALLPVEHRRPIYNIQEDCSLRSVTGFKLHKRIVKKYFAVPNIYECEVLCFKERDFLCESYAYRYTITVSEPTHNCYLSNLNYKELDHYTDLEPDRDFDIYTMNNKNRCNQPAIERRDDSDCFWRVRSGERLHQKIVRDSLKANSIVDCQVECLSSTKFTCRAYSYRYGPPIVRGSIDNCQLTDWPYYELDPRAHFEPEPGFEVYERGSFGHGCETGHFGIRGHLDNRPKQLNPDQLCYIGFGSPARLLPQAIKKSLHVSSELECKEECTRARLKSLFQCMSFSFWSKGSRNVPNCYLSDIYQRDLLAKLDYVYDPNALLFAWDNYNPDCVLLANDPVHTNHISGGGPIDRDYFSHALDTWRVYSVNGWPCKRGALCKENVRTGFWFCEIEGGEHGAWDYCCRPDHQCGASNGYPYLWCYVGPDRTQWRRCNDRYYPYIHNTDRIVDGKYLPPGQSRPWRPPLFRPDRLPSQNPLPPPKPSLDQYEMIFDEEFLEPPKPGGLGQPRHWPVSYLHKEMPPNVTDSRLMRMTADTKYSAIQNLIDVIKNNDLKSVQYHISNQSNNKDDVLFVKIPLPTNFTIESTTTPLTIDLEPITLDDDAIESKRFQKSLPQFVTKEDSTVNLQQFQTSRPRFVEWNTKQETTEVPESSFAEISKPSSVYRRGFIERANVTTHGRRLR
uniref:Uncharacterized protein LOC114338448 n=1 Tax=Diabrotica virgifera virgifera TaxID=50390 RepID=A0A6P7GI62_DIAVI